MKLILVPKAFQTSVILRPIVGRFKGSDARSVQYFQMVEFSLLVVFIDRSSNIT